MVKKSNVESDGYDPNYELTTQSGKKWNKVPIFWFSWFTLPPVNEKGTILILFGVYGIGDINKTSRDNDIITGILALFDKERGHFKERSTVRASLDGTFELALCGISMKELFDKNDYEMIKENIIDSAELIKILNEWNPDQSLLEAYLKPALVLVWSYPEIDSNILDNIYETLLENTNITATNWLGADSDLRTTFYIFTLLNVMNKYDSFVISYPSLLLGATKYVLSLRDTVSNVGFFENLGGFVTEDNKPLISLEATWQAHCLMKLFTSTGVMKSVDKLEDDVALHKFLFYMKFLSSVQFQDGSFNYYPWIDDNEFYHFSGSSGDTAMGIFMLEYLYDMVSISSYKKTFIFPWNQYGNAVDYLLACIRNGIRIDIDSDIMDISDASKYLVLSKTWPDWPNRVGGISGRAFNANSMGLGILLLSIAVYYFYRWQLLKMAVFNLWNSNYFKISVGGLFLTFMVSYVNNYVTVLMNFIYALSLLFVFFFVQASTTSTLPDLILFWFTILSNSGLLFLFFVVALKFLPHTFRYFNIYYVLLGYTGLSTMIVTILGSLMIKPRGNTLRTFQSASFLAWILDTVLLFIFSLVDDDYFAVLKISSYRGVKPLLMIFLPLFQLHLMQIASLAGCELSSTAKGRTGVWFKLRKVKKKKN